MINNYVTTYICARCKKEITDEESKWIGNHRFCTDCAASPKAVTNNITVKSKENAKDELTAQPQRYVGATIKPKQDFSENVRISEVKKRNAAIRAVSELLSKQYYYVASADNFKNRDTVFMLLLSRDRKKLLGIETSKEPNHISVMQEKLVELPSDITITTLSQFVLSNFNYNINEDTANSILARIQSTIGYEFIPVWRLQDLFIIKETLERQQRSVGYDKLTGKPFLIERNGKYITAHLITLKEVMNLAKEHAPQSKFTGITDESWETFIDIDVNMLDESTTFQDLLLDGNDIFCVTVNFKEENGERLPLFGSDISS